MWNRPRNEPKTVIFCKKEAEKKYGGSFYSNKNNNNRENNSQKLFLLESKLLDHLLQKIIPRNFSLSTKNGTCTFNVEMLKETSPVITEYIKSNPTENQFNLNINDEENVLHKFEQLFQGLTVFFDEDDLPISQRITKILQFKNCPNYLKPESLRINERYSNGKYISNWSSSKINLEMENGVEINRTFFIEFLKDPKFQTFVIKTNKKQYKCNVFGVSFSDVIRQKIENEPTINEFVFDFEDEDDEFQLICNLFNFGIIDIKSDNMDLLKEIATDLQINCIKTQIDDFISNYEKFNEKVDEQQTIIDSINNLFDLLYNINNYGIDNVKESIVQSKWSQSEENVQELAAFILQVIKPNLKLHKEMAELLIKLNNEANSTNKLDILVPFIVDKLLNFPTQMEMKVFNQNDLNQIILNQLKFKKKYSYLKQNNFKMCNYFDDDSQLFLVFIRVLYNKGIISKEEITNMIKDNIDNNYVLKFFLPEVYEINPSIINSIKIDPTITINYSVISIETFYTFLLDHYLPDKIDLYKKMLDSLEPDDEITKSLRHDDVDTLQTIITRSEIAISKAHIPYNIFDHKTPTFIDYAALYGSIKCFKYLLLNDASINNNSLYYALSGGNTEIIKIVDQRSTDLQSELSDDKTIKPAIVIHRNDLFDWIFENRFVNKKIDRDLLDYIAVISADNGNAHSLIEVIDKGLEITCNIISDAAKNGFYQLTQLLLSIIEPKIKQKLIDINSDFEFISIVQFKNIKIFELFIDLMNQSNHENVFLQAIYIDFKKIIDYYFDNFEKLDFQLTSHFVNTALNVSFQKKTNYYYNLLIEKFKEIKPEYFVTSFYSDLLKNSLKYNNFSVSMSIIETILNKDPNFNFSTAFLEASSSGLSQICQYLIDKKAFIDYNDFINLIAQLGSIKLEHFQLIINNINPNIKQLLYGCIKEAIKCNNKELAEFLLKERQPFEDELFLALSMNSIELVELVLKYNSKPSFINKKSSEGTALHIACINNNLDIVKLLLSVPGIDPSLVDQQNHTTLLIAIENENFDIFNAIIDFYGDDFQYHMNFLMVTLNSIQCYQENHWKYLKRIMEIKSLDPNLYYQQSTIFYKVCASKIIEGVKFLLSLEHIDPNAYEIDSYYTPLIFALEYENIEIAKLLIKHPKTDINLKSANNESAFYVSINKGFTEIVEILLNDERFDPKENEVDYAFCYSNATISKMLISTNFVDINHVFDNQMTALIKSVQMNNNEKIDLIINHPSFDKDKSNINQAIFIAAEQNYTDIYKKLIKLINDDVNIYNNGEHLLIVASSRLSYEIVDEIINNNKFEPKNDQLILEAFIKVISRTPINQNKLPQLKENEILWKNLTIRITNYRRRQIDLCNDERDEYCFDVMKKIYEYDQNHSKSIDFKKLLPNGKSFFTCISRNFDKIKEVSDFLLERGVDPNMPDANGIYPLENAVMINSLGFICSLIESNKIDYHQLSNGNSYLHIAASFTNINTFQYLLDLNQFDMNSTNNDGETPLFYACKSKNVAIVDLLFSSINDLDYLHCNKNGLDALSIVIKLNPDEIKKVKESKESYHQKIISSIKEMYKFSKNFLNKSPFF